MFEQLRQNLVDMGAVRRILVEIPDEATAIAEAERVVGPHAAPIARRLLIHAEIIARLTRPQLAAAWNRLEAVRQQFDAIKSAPEEDRPLVYRNAASDLIRLGLLAGAGEEIPDYPGMEILTLAQESLQTTMRFIETAYRVIGDAEAALKRGMVAQ